LYGADVVQVPNVDDVARWLGRPTPPPVDLGIYEGGGEEDLEPPKPVIPDSYKDMPQAKVFRVRLQSPFLAESLLIVDSLGKTSDLYRLLAMSVGSMAEMTGL
jgi:hypothetical protein